MNAQLCNRVHPQAAAQATRGLVVNTCTRPANHLGRCVHAAEYRSPYCRFCFHETHDQQCPSRMRLALVDGAPWLDCPCPLTGLTADETEATP